MTVRYPNVLLCTFLLLGFLGPILSYVTYRSIVPLCVLAACSTIVALGPSQSLKAIQNLSLPEKLIAPIFVSWLLITTLWSPDTGRSLLSVLKFSGTAIVIFFLLVGASKIDNSSAKKIVISLGLSILLVAFLWVSDIFSNGSISFFLFKFFYREPFGYYWFKAALTIISFSALIIGYIFWKLNYKFFTFSTIVLLLFLMVSFNSRTLMVALPIAIIGAFALKAIGRNRIKFLIGALFISSLILVSNMGKTFTAAEVSNALPRNASASQSVIYRMHIWTFTINKIRDKFLFGWGLGTSRSIGQDSSTIDPNYGNMGEALPLHPHNLALHILLETGLVGYILFLTLIYLILNNFDQNTKKSSASSICFLTITILAIALWHFNYSAWASWWLHQLGFTSAMMIVAMRTSTAFWINKNE